MGMNGLVFVRPLQDGNTALYPAASTSTTTATARPASTASSRCSCPRCGPSRTGPTPTSSCPEWSDYRADFSLLNGRVYPDTLAPERRRSTRSTRSATRNGDLIAPDGPSRAAVPAALVARELQRRRPGGAAVRQPRVPGAGDDARRASGCGSSAATPPRCGDATAPTPRTRPTRINIGPGESFDVIFTAPAHAGPGGRLRHLHALQPQLHAVEQPGAGRFRRPGDRDPRVPERGRRPRRQYPNDWGV